jgi:L-arginine dehydrogenase
MPACSSRRVPRVSEPPIVRQGRLKEKLSTKEVLGVLRESFAGLGKGLTIQPPQMLAALPEGRGDVIAYFGVLGNAGTFGVKLSPYFTDGPRVTSWTLVMSMATGQPLLLCDSLNLTIERTAATTMLALEYLLEAQAGRLAVIGLGSIGLAHLRYATSEREWEQILLYSPSLAADPSLLRRVPKKLRRKASVAKSAEEAVRESDAVLLCTSSASPVIDYRWLKPGCFVSSIATNAPNAHEISPEALLHCEVFCDFRSTTPLVAGEMLLAARDHEWSPDSIRADLPELLTGRGQRPTGKAPVFFRSVGLGMEDIAVATLLFARMSNKRGGPSV